MKSRFKCPKCGKSTLGFAMCEDGVAVYSCDNEKCEFYAEFKIFPITKWDLRNRAWLP